MKVKEFLRQRQSIVTAPCVPQSFDDDLVDFKRVFVPVLTPNGVLVNVQKSVKSDSLDVPYTTYSNDFMIKNGVKQLKDVPMSSFAVFDAIREVVNNKNVES